LSFAPIIVFGGLMFWAIQARQRLNGDQQRKATCVRVLWLTPFSVCVAFAVGIVLTVLAYVANVRTNGQAFGSWAVLCALWGPPSVVLLTMLKLAWRCR
jgi:hypothetical protein